jgi:hypothetical protein
MPSRAHGPEPCASANFATRAHPSTTSRQLSEISTMRGPDHFALVTWLGDRDHGERHQQHGNCGDGGDEKNVRFHKKQARRRRSGRLRIVHRLESSSKATRCRAH